MTDETAPAGETDQAEATSLLDKVRATRASRQDADRERRAQWVADQATAKALEVARAGARKRIKAAAYAGKPADPADVALALGEDG